MAGMGRAGWAGLGWAGLGKGRPGWPGRPAGWTCSGRLGQVGALWPLSPQMLQRCGWAMAGAVWSGRLGQAGLGNFGNRAHFRRRRGWAGIASSICNADPNVRPLRSSDRHLFFIYVHHQVCIFAAFRTSTRSMTFTGSARRFRLAAMWLVTTGPCLQKW